MSLNNSKYTIFNLPSKRGKIPDTMGVRTPRRNWRIYYDWIRGSSYIDLSVRFGILPIDIVKICKRQSVIASKKLARVATQPQGSLTTIKGKWKSHETREENNETTV